MKLLQQVIRPDILAQSQYVVQNADNMVKLDAMENPYPLPPQIQAELAQVLAQVALNRYPVPTYSALKQKICQQFDVPAGFDVLLGNGSDELIAMLSIACAKADAKILAPVTTFVMYAISAQLAGLEFVGVPLQADLSLDLPAMLAAIKVHRPAIVYVSNPNNPTGSWFSQADLVAILNAMQDIGLVVVDEAYKPFAPTSMMSRLPEFAHLVVMQTVSKIGLAGLRLGYMSAHAAILAQIDKVRPPYNINVLTATAAEFLLTHKSVFDQQANLLCEQRGVLLNALQKIPKVTVFASQANFVLIKIENAEQVFKKLLAQQILIKNVGRMHVLLENCLRVTVSTPEENQLFLNALQTILNED